MNDPQAFLVTAEQGAAILGVSKRFFYCLRGVAGFPAALQLGERAIRYERDALLAFARSRASEPQTEPERLAAGKVRRNSPLPEAAPFKASEAVASAIPRRVRGSAGKTGGAS